MSLTPRADNTEENLVINGGFPRWQRAGALVAVNTTTSFAYYADRWQSRHTGTFTGTPNLIRSTTVDSERSTNSLQHTFRRNASTAVFEHQQKVESINARKLVAFGSGSFSLKIQSTLATGFIRVKLLYPTAADNYASSVEFYNSGLISVSSAGVWQSVSADEISIPANAANGVNMVIEYSLPSGTDGSSQNFLISEVMLNAGLRSADFTPAGGDVSAELQKCQRYYSKSYNQDTIPTSVTSVGCEMWTQSRTGSDWQNTTLPVRMRTTPTVIVYSPGSGAANMHAQDDVSAGDFGANLSNQGERGFASYHSGNDGAQSRKHWTADAEIA